MLICRVSSFASPFKGAVLTFVACGFVLLFRDVVLVHDVVCVCNAE